MLATIATLLGTLALASGPAVQVSGEYVEARNADVYTGPCFSNAEVFITGDRAVMAWKVTEGSYQGQDLRGLSIAAAVRGTTTFSKDNPSEARSVLIVDQAATPAQREALIALAKDLGGDRLKHVEAVRTALVQVSVDKKGHHAAEPASPHHGMPKAPRGRLYVDGLAEILTRPLEESDHACGNEVVEYPPLSRGVTALPAYTLEHAFKGQGLNTTWDDANCRSSFVGKFAR